MNTLATRRARRSEPLKQELDAASLVRARKGDPEACRALVQRHQGLVFSILSRMLAPAGRLDRLEDLAQETFLKIFGALDGFKTDGPAKLSTWIGTIASRVAIDELRKPRPQVSESAKQDAPAVEQAAEDAHRRQLRRALERALAVLSPEARALFLLRAYHGWSHRELADAFEVPAGTIKSRLARAREVLRRELSGVVEVDDGR